MHGLMYCEKLLHPLMLLLENIQVCSALLTKESIIFFYGLVTCTALVKASCPFPRDGVALEATGGGSDSRDMARVAFLFLCREPSKEGGGSVVSRQGW